MGGYFVVNGNKKHIRCLIIPRSNHVMDIICLVFVKWRNFYTQFACQFGGVRNNQTSQTNTLYYLLNSNLTFRFSWQKSEYIIPAILLLNALLSGSNQEFFAGLTQNKFDNNFCTDWIKLLLCNFKHYNLFISRSCREFLGQKFEVVLGCPEDWADEKIGVYLIDRLVLVHLLASQSVFENMRLRKTYLKRVLQVFGQLNNLDLKSWIDEDSKTWHLPLPTQTNLVNAISTLEDLKMELNNLGGSDHSAGMELIAEFWQCLSNRQDTVVMLKSFVDLSKLIVECDLSFSRLLNKLDELSVGKRDEGVGKAQITAFKVFTCLRETSTSIDQDTRIRYQIKRLNQTWEELCDMIKDCCKSSELP
ncbi:hypothetical protein PPACK8108_LOCUS14104 [Phakopsora pachyrhizi]|uniref:RNA polymerase Rpb2 domain-containing protein n=1 Tax=Phakopsora pachyrhizi TaxID=170000 RepID=A0AAV0B7A9_PHAPC|nr:hypothetical protein PPACK8108_LOCUS14104 [Phakopsora pachyrhizi]